MLARAAGDAGAADGPVAAASAPAIAAAPAALAAAYFVKSAASLADLEKTLQGKGGHSADLLKPATTAGLEIVWRHEEDNEQKELEVHDGKDHVFFVTDGQATFTLGGQLTGAHQISPGEWRAAHAQGAQTIDVAKGDLIFIPHGTVHGRSAKGRRFTMLQLSFWPGGAAGSKGLPSNTQALPATPSVMPTPSPARSQAH